jgi:GT2 family glycosyltransferase/glycosyltransferase involved in cell wall biosynthesis
MQDWRIYCYNHLLPSRSYQQDAIDHYNSNHAEHRYECVNTEFFKDSNTLSKNLLFLCHTVPTHDQDSGSNRIIEILKLLIAEGYSVYYLTHTDIPKYTQYLYDIGIKKVLVADHKNKKYCHHYIEDLCFNTKLVFDTIIFEFYEIYTAYWSKIHYLIPNTKIIIDSVDVHWVRKFNNPSIKTSDISLLNIEKDNEKLAYNSADVVFAVTEEDKKEILSECPNANVKIVSNIHHKYDYDLKSPNERVKDLIFVGGDNHPPNTTALLDSIKIFETFLQQYPEFGNSKLHIVGNRQINLPNHPSIIIHNQISDVELKQLYNNVYGSLSPISWGSGIKGKVCESIANFVPVITSNMGSSGLDLLNNKEGFIANTTDEYIKAINHLFNIDAETFIKLTKKAYKKLKLITGPESAKQVIDGTLSSKPIILSIVTHNNSYLLQRCIESILNNTTYNNYKIHVTSNACSDDTPIVMQYFTKNYNKIIYKYNTENKYFIHAHNDVIKLFNSCDIVLLNEDIEILSKCWLTSLYQSAYSTGYIGCVGGKIILKDGKLGEAGSEIYNSGEGRNIGRHQNPNNPKYNITKYVGYVSGCMMYMRRDAINKFGSLDTRYYPCYYEDSDWQYNLHIHGYKTIYQPKAIALHREGSSCGTDINNENSLKKYMKINKLKFIEKYKQYNLEAYNS